MIAKFFQNLLLPTLLLIFPGYTNADKAIEPVHATNVKSNVYTIDFYQSYSQNTPYPLDKELTTITEQQAYSLQQQFVKQLLHNNYPVGYKAGLTSLAARQRFQVATPVAGVLLASAHNKNHQLQTRDFQQMMLETEIGFIAAKAIQEPQKDINKLKSFFVSIVPVVEVPDLAYEDLTKLKVQHLIATNIAARQFITGAEKPIKSINLQQLQTSLLLNSTLISKGKATDAMGDQWQALQWLVNRTLSNGWPINKGNILITGALGKMQVAKAGNYRAEFGPLGNIEFSVTANTKERQSFTP